MKRRQGLMGWVVLAMALAVVWWLGFAQEDAVVLMAQGPRGSGRPAESNNVSTDANAPSGARDAQETTGPSTGAPESGQGRSTTPDGGEGSTTSTEQAPAAARVSPTEPEAPPVSAAEPPASTAAGTLDRNTAAEPSPPGEDPNNPMESLNLKDVQMKDLVQKIGQWTGKVIIPVDDAMKQKLTIFAPEKLPRKEALALIYSALRTQGYVAEETERVIYLKPIEKAKLGQVPTIPSDQPLAALENKEQIVQRFVKLRYAAPDRMEDLIKSFVGPYGEIRPDASTQTLLVIDTVANLMRIERIVREFDVPESEQTAAEIFTLQNADALEVVQMLRILLGDAGAVSSRDRGRTGRPASGPSGGGAASFMGPNRQPIVLIPVSKYKWIIARAAPPDLKTIGQWIDRLDLEDEVKSEYETLPVVYADAREVASRIEEALADLPGSELKPSVLLRPLEQSRQVMIFGRKDLREMVKQMIQEIDIPSGEFEKKTFTLKYADPEQIKANIDSLYGDEQEGTNRNSYYYYLYLSRRQTHPGDMVRVIAFPTMQQVSVICSPEKMRKIEKQIADWDVPLEVDKVKPQIYSLKNSDPVQMADLLTRLFSEEEQGFDFFDWYFGESSDNKKKIVGPLYGQLTFEEVPGTKKIIVISKIPEAYRVVKELIDELDSQEMAETPRVITVKYADPEVLAERLNALFNERGTPASFRLEPRGLSAYDMSDQRQDRGSSDNSDRGGNGSSDGASDRYETWWSQGSDPRDQEPLSNVIGRVRFIPDSHSKSILVLSPPEFYDQIETMIRQLDVPGKQVMVKAVIVQVDHSSMTSLGVQLATNPAAFGDLSENSLLALGNLTHLATHGSAAFDASSPLGAVGSGSILGGSVDVYALIDFLRKTVHARILNQQSLWTKDNAEADFFKGQNVAFQTNISISDTGGRVTSGLERSPVGMTLRVRPSVTPEQRVDMIVNIILSQLTGELVNNQPVTSEVKTTTNMIVRDGQTIMLGGILFQRNSQIQRKLPLLGDLPLVGGLFRHEQAVLANSELIVFITPYVMEDGDLANEASRAAMDEPLRKLDRIERQLEQTTAAVMPSDPNAG